MGRAPPSGARSIGVLGSGPRAETLARRLAGSPFNGSTPSSVIIGCAESERELRALLDEYRDGAAGESPATLLELSPIAAAAQIELAATLAEAGLTVIGGRQVPLADGRTALYVDDVAVAHPAFAALLPLLADEIVPTGDAGNAKMVGMLVDLLVGVNTAITREAIALGECAGIDAATLVRLISTGSGANAVLARAARVGGPDESSGSDDERVAIRRGVERAATEALSADHSLFFGSLAIASLLGTRDAGIAQRPSGATVVTGARRSA